MSILEMTAGHVPRGWTAATPQQRCDYSVYGITIRSEIPLGLPTGHAGRPPEVSLLLASPRWFSGIEVPTKQSESSSYEYGCSPDGLDVVRWPGLFEFAVLPDGRSVVCNPLDRATTESFQTYLLGQVLSFALVKQGYEPLHATAVVVDGRAVVFLADSGRGKSTLGAEFVRHGHEILTDDLLLIREVDGALNGFPGPARVKLFPSIAARILPGLSHATPMHPNTPKLVIPLEHRQHHDRPVPIDRFFVLDEVDEGITDVRVEPLAGVDSLLQLLRSSFNVRLVSPDRLRRQLLAAQAWRRRIPVRRLSYPRNLGALEEVRRTILRDIRSVSRVS